jgi:hypothetical protein
MLTALTLLMKSPTAVASKSATKRCISGGQLARSAQAFLCLSGTPESPLVVLCHWSNQRLQNSGALALPGSSPRRDSASRNSFCQDSENPLRCASECRCRRRLNFPQASSLYYCFMVCSMFSFHLNFPTSQLPDITIPGFTYVITAG